MQYKQVSVLLLAGATLFAPVFAGSSAELQQRLERLERRVGHLSELTLEVEAMKRQNRQLQGRVEEQQHQLERMRQKQRELYLDLDQRIGAGVTSMPTQVEATNPVTETPAISAPQLATTISDPAKAQDAYDQAYNLLRPEQRRYDEAIVAFARFLKNYPDSELLDNAQYWLAEANYVTQKNAAALTHFKKLVQQYPASPKVPGALLKIGYILDASGKRTEAKKYLNQVMTDYASSPAAGMAKQRMSMMR